MFAARLISAPARFAAFCLAVALAAAPTTFAQPRPEETPEPQEAEEETGESSEEVIDPCSTFNLESDAWIDRMRQAVAQRVCASAVWFDSFFGDERLYEETDAPYGRLGVRVPWDERDGFDLDVDFRAKVVLPQAERRLNAFLRRGNRDDFITDSDDTFQDLPEVFRDVADDEWLLGLGYNPARSESARLDFDAGIKLDWPPDPFVKARYRKRMFVTDKRLGRFRQTLFWELDEGLGTTTRFDLERLVRPRLLARWRTVTTLSQSTEGVDWQTGLTFYQYLGGERAMAYQLGIFGETDDDVPLQDYVVQLIYRQKAFRDWLFIELRTSVSWPREELDEVRETNYGLGVGFEMKFGRER